MFLSGLGLRQRLSEDRICRFVVMRLWGAVRRVDSRLLKGGRRLVAIGDTNFSFHRRGWETVDLVDADYLCDLRVAPLPFADGSVDAVYSSHMIEHIPRNAGLRLLREVHRCLKTGATCRLATPDMDRVLGRYNDGDWSFFLRNGGRLVFDRVCKGALAPEALLIHNRLIGWFASYSGRVDTGGGPLTDRATVDEQLAVLSKYDFRDWCVSLLEPGRAYAHVHLYDYQELSESMRKAGFGDVRREEYGSSACPAMRDPPIDREEHREYSLYVEATR